MSNEFLTALKDKKTAAEEERLKAIQRISELVGFLNTREGLTWLNKKAKENGEARVDGENFSVGFITACVLRTYQVSREIPDRQFGEEDILIVVEGQEGIVREVWFSQKIDMYFPDLGRKISYSEKSNLEVQKNALEIAKEKAQKEHPRVKEEQEKYQVVICGINNSDSNPFACMLLRKYSPSDLVGSIGVMKTKSFCDGFLKALQKE